MNMPAQQNETTTHERATIGCTEISVVRNTGPRDFVFYIRFRLHQWNLSKLNLKFFKKI